MKWRSELEVKLGWTELKLVEAKSLNLAQIDEIANLKAILEDFEDKWYNANFANAKNFVEPIVYKHGGNDSRKVGWLPFKL